MSFLSAIFGGSSPTLNSAVGQFGQVAGYGIGQGEGDTTASSNFFKSILSGDSSKIAQSLAPAISSDKVSTAQDTKTNALFGGRSGGTAARNASAGDKVHSDITNLIGNLTGSSASTLGSMGSSLLNTGTNALSGQVGADAERISNWQNSIFGGALTGGAAIGMKALSNWAVPNQNDNSGGQNS